MDRNTIIGFVLIFLLLIVWQRFMTPSAEELEQQKRVQDSIALAEKALDEKVAADTANVATQPVEAATEVDDSTRMARMNATFGPFTPASTGTEELITLENDLMKVIFTNKGGRIKEVELKKYYKILNDKKGEELKAKLKLLEDAKNRFDYLLPVAGLPSGGVNTGDLYFKAEPNNKTLVFRAPATNGGYFEQRYELADGTYAIQYTIKFEGLQQVLSNDAQAIQLTWLNYLDKLEINSGYERNYSTLYFKPAEDSPDYCSCTSNDVEEIKDQPVKWISHTNQFFNTSLVADQSFKSARLETIVLDPADEDLKILNSQLALPYKHTPSETFAMTLYTGPNEFKQLRAMGHELEDIIPFGWTVFGTINRWVIRPIFNFLSSFIGSAGIVILVLTFLVKMALFPLTYKMLYSQSKMGALKPQIESLKNKFKDDPQQQQMETMKMYREHGVNPLGGCMPMLLQMPIWFALYRFFPASIEFRQAGFLWATDLSSYDVFWRLPFELPLGFGAHISMFTLLWALTTLAYTYYNTQHMDFGSNPMMKWMQYIMPVMFLGFFNSFASGLTCYLLFSNLVNIGQTVVTKNYIIDQEKIKSEMEAYRKQPKKKSGFQERLEAAMKEQQRQKEQKEQAKKKK